MQAAYEEESMAGEIKRIVHESPALTGALAGISIRSADTGELVYEHDADIRMRPASNMKLLTAAAALETLGEEHVFQTELYIKGIQVANVLQGDVYLKGKGDPTLLEKDFDGLAKVLKQHRIHYVHGDLIGDDTWYDDEGHSPDLIRSDEQEYYGSAVSALTAAPDEEYDTGTVLLEISPGKRAGKKATVTMQPETDYVTVVNEAITVSPDGKQKIKVERDHERNVLTVTGTMPEHGLPTKEYMAVIDPTKYALRLFEQSMERQGIKVLGTTKQGKTPAQARKIASHDSMTLSQLLVPFMKLSNNTHAEVLVKEMGKAAKGEGSWENGLKIAESKLELMGMDTQSTMMRDGSGISQVNLISANELTKLLYSVREKTWFPSYLNALPVAGVKEKMIGGTLRNRMEKTAAVGNVRAKTGTISATSTLSGYVTTKSGEGIIFSILLNNFVEEKGIRDIQDKIVVWLAEQEDLLERERRYSFKNICL
ncbi:D-alanyl-D-alanine carboxypeptidase/D-alanyl-D-alanine-endopeptidase [Peribacillus sp. NPDC097225]|uniref:D-alanyl-D-alanine carboxypeptidase/D-alanyl-D-alanine endopeptidase n=1 Tax=Peribacillus sp. NPDC097225 TaxID=3364400 RepID=UPI00380956F8